MNTYFSSRLKSLKEYFTLPLANELLNQWGVVFIFFFPMQGKNSGKFLWPGLSSDLINPSWDPEDSVACSIPSGQDQSRHCHFSCGTRVEYTSQSLFWGCSELRPAPFTPFWFTPRTHPLKKQGTAEFCAVSPGSWGACWLFSTEGLLPGPAAHSWP